MSKRKGFTHAEHTSVGGRLQLIRKELGGLLVIACHAYGPNNRTTCAFKQAEKAIDSLRSVMDDACATDLGDKFDPSIYYGFDGPRPEKDRLP